jgi:hypothetical protein
MDWNFFGRHIGVVSCVGDERRRERAKENMKRVGINTKCVQWGNFERKPGNNTIAENHISFARRAYDAGAHALLMFEDDVEFFEERLANRSMCKSIMGRIRRTDTYDIFFLGHVAVGPTMQTGRGVIRTSYPLGTHALILSRSGMKMVIDHVPCEKQSFDNWIASTMPRKYAAFPSLAWQSVCHSVPKWMGPRGFVTIQNMLEYGWLMLLYGVILTLLVGVAAWLMLRGYRTRLRCATKPAE